VLVSLNWLKEYVEINKDPAEFGDMMTMSGTKVETFAPVSDVVQGIFTGRIQKIEKHPNADKLQVCTMDMGPQLGGRTIITSATNVFEGAVVPVALEGAVIGNGTVMEAADFRGVQSQGMMCSVEEMGMDTDLFSKEILNGIYIMPEGVEPGSDIRSLMWVDDQIFDLEITANRSDCQSIYGIAREAAATLNEPVKDVDLYDQSAETGSQIEKWLSVGVESDLCIRYTAKMFKVRKIEASPLWMQLKLLNSGVRPINNIVDVTNYVMLELGQPLHAFDYKSIGSNQIIVKTTDDQSVVTLDDKERAIDDSMLMITNGEKPIAVAGVMGGANSEITDQTEYVVLESACFDKTSIRLTSKKLGLRTEASGRYEKGLYPNLTMMAAMRATALLQEIGACEVIPGIIDVYPHPTSRRVIDVDCGWINRFLGTEIPTQEMITILNRLFLPVEEIGENALRVTVPDYRQDLNIREDIAEEVARIYGYDKLPATIMGGTTLVGEKTPAQKFRDRIEALLIGSGYYQTLTTSFTSAKRYQDMAMADGEDRVVLKNPLGEDSALMRNNLAGHQLELIALNANRNNGEGRFFEIAKTYHKGMDAHTLPVEKTHLVLSAYGADADYFTLKGMVEAILAASGITDGKFTAGGPELLHPGRKAILTIAGQAAGHLGEIHPKVVKAMDLPKRTYLCELDFDVLTKAANLNVKYRDLPIYPGSSRDIAVILDENIPAAQILDCIKAHDHGLISAVHLFDVYHGKQIPSGKKSLAYSIDFLHLNRTLTDDDINPVMEEIIRDLKETFDADLRE
jgi:phenylalanyl-tRNA synthetase beta chain